MSNMLIYFIVFFSWSFILALVLLSVRAIITCYYQANGFANMIRQLQPLCPCAECQKRGVR